MVFTRSHIRQFKISLLAAVFSLLVQLSLPQVVLAAEEKYSDLGIGETAADATVIFLPPGLADDLLDQEEQLSAPAWPEADETRPFLPLEGAPKTIKTYWLTVTAYSSEPRQTDSTPFTTAWQTPVRDGVAAINFLPLGSLVRFPDEYGDKIFVVEDRMNARYQYRADIWMHTRAAAKTFGMYYLRMELLGPRFTRDYVRANFAPAFPGQR